MKLKHRNRLLWIASILSRRATAIRRYVKARTPKRPTKFPFVVVDDPAVPEGQADFIQKGRVVGRITGIGQP